MLLINQDLVQVGDTVHYRAAVGSAKKVRTRLSQRIGMGLLFVIFLTILVTGLAALAWPQAGAGLVGTVGFGVWAAALWRGRLVIQDGVLRVHDVRAWSAPMELSTVRTASYTVGARSGGVLTLISADLGRQQHRRFALVPRYSGMVVITQLLYPMRKVLRVIAPLLPEDDQLLAIEDTSPRQLLRKALRH